MVAPPPHWHTAGTHARGGQSHSQAPSKETPFHAQPGPAPRLWCAIHWPAPPPRCKSRRPAARIASPPHTHVCGNDPPAGSPTGTLLRLLLPLAEEHRLVSAQERPGSPRVGARGGGTPTSTILYPCTIGSNDGRCVQMTGTQSVRADDSRILGIPRSWQTVADANPQHGTGCWLPARFRTGPPTAHGPAAPVEGPAGGAGGRRSHALRISVVRVRPRTFRGITDLLSPFG